MNMKFDEEFDKKKFCTSSDFLSIFKKVKKQEDQDEQIEIEQ